MRQSCYDVAIIGAGPAGLSAAIYMARAKYKVLVLEKEKIDIMIDDRPETCLTLSENNIHTFYFREKDSPFLQDNKYLLQEHQR